MGDEMAEDLTDDGEFSHLALCVCNAAENISASEDEWAHIQSLLPEKFHHLLCSYTLLDSTSLNHADQTELGCNVVSTVNISDLTDAACGYELPASAPDSTGVMCELRDAYNSGLIHDVSSSQLNTVVNGLYESSSTARTTDTDVRNSSDAYTCDHNLSGLPIGRVGFRARLRVNVENLTELELWQRSFAERSKTTMRCANLFRCAGKKTLYKTRMRCQHNTFPRSTSADRRKSSKNTHCPAVMRLTLKRSKVFRKLSDCREVRRLNRSQDIHMPEYPLVVTMDFTHNHPLDTASVLRHRDVAPYVLAKFANLLNIGHGPLAALAIHKYDLYLEHGPRHYLTFVNDRHHFPDAGWCYRQCYKLGQSQRRRHSSGAASSITLSECLDECSNALRQSVARLSDTTLQSVSDTDHPLAGLLQLSPDAGRTALSVTSDESFIACEMLSDGECVVAVCTPLMKRVHRLVPQSADVVVVDVGLPVDKRRRCRVVVLATGSSVGGLPLGVLASSSDTSLQRAVELYAGLLDSRCFYGRGRQRGPALLLVDDCPALRTALCTVFTASSCLLCSCRLLTSFWQELWDRRSTVSIDQRLHCFALFRAAVLADTVDQLDARFVDVQGKCAMLSSASTQSHALSVYERRAEWSLCYQKPDWCPSTAGARQTTRGLCNYASRALKDAVLDQVKSMRTAETLVTFVTQRLDRFYERRLTDTVRGQVEDASAVRFMQDPASQINADVTATIPPSQFEVTLQPAGLAGMTDGLGDSSTRMCQVELSVGLCSCSVGCSGAPCLHQWAAVHYSQARSLWLIRPVTSVSARRVLAHIATGRGYADTSWFASLHPLCSDDDLVVVDDDCNSGSDDVIVPATAASTDHRQIGAEETVDVLVTGLATAIAAAPSELQSTAIVNTVAPTSNTTGSVIIDNRQMVVNWNGLEYELSFPEAAPDALIMEPANALTIVPSTRHRLSQALSKIESAYLNHPEMMETAVGAFCQTVESIDFVEHLNSALLCFGNSFLTSGSATL